MRPDPVRQPALRWTSVAIPAVVGAVVVFLAWFSGPGLFGIDTADTGTSVQAEIVKPTTCTMPDPVETVRFSFEGKNREGTLSGCGHGPGERVEVSVPSGAAAEGTLAVRAAKTSQGSSDLRMPLGLALLVFSCFAGAYYVFLYVRGPRVAVS
ncbi:hypothetical protein [Amycolatopsis sp. NPDC059021]|uniref:hypothetical protein n=1 Tax=Amycolatopsis sp. NPDC059021 TaxID=3346704 RepID=UPI00366AC47B